jgi:hypothetical protein
VSMDGGATWPVWLPTWQVKRAVAMDAKRERDALRTNPQHTEACGTAFRGCSPECTFERDQPAERPTGADALRGLTFGGMLHTLELAGALTRAQVEVLQAGADADAAAAAAARVETMTTTHRLDCPAQAGGQCDGAKGCRTVWESR